MKPPDSRRRGKIAVYLDTNIFCRPFDDLTDERIFEEASIVIELIKLCELKVIDVYCSEILLTELSNIEDVWKRENAEALAASLCTKTVAHSDIIEALADKLSKVGLDYIDSLHIASACISGAEHVITCDDEMVSKGERIQEIVKQRGLRVKIENPKAFISRLKNTKVGRRNN